MDALVIIKPHAVPRSQEILRYLDKQLFQYGRLVLQKDIASTPRQIVERHYQEHKGKPYFPNLVEQFTDKPITLGVYRSSDDLEILFIPQIVQICGPTDPSVAKRDSPKSIRSLFTEDNLALAISQGRAVDNVIHRPDSMEAARREIMLWSQFLKVVGV